MGRGPHLFRRVAAYYWQRRLPQPFAKCLCISHIKVNLNTKDVATARRLAVLLDARAVEVFEGDMQNLDKEQLGSIFRSVLIEHRTKLGMLADLER